MQMLVMLWRIVTNVLRHLGWGILLVPVAAMGMALFGLNLWTIAAVIFAAVVAVQWPAAAARALPFTMVGAGASGLVVAGRVSGSPVNWVVDRISAAFPQPLAKMSLHGPRWAVFGPKGRFQVSTSPAGVQALLPKNALTPKNAGGLGAAARQVIAKGKGKRPPIPKRVAMPQKRVVIPQQGVSRSFTITQKGITQNISVNGAGPGHVTFSVPRINGAPPSAFGGHIAGRPPWAVVRGPALPGLWDGRLLVPLALLLLTLGLWLTPRSLAGLRGRGATLAPDVRRWLVANRWGVLLVPVTLVGLTIFGVHPWTIAAIIAAIVVLARWPRIAADLVPVVLAVFAVRGFELAANWQSMSAFAGPRFGLPPAPPAVDYSGILVHSAGTALLAGAGASAFLALGAWLVPRTIGTHARTVFTPGTDLELAGRVQRLTETRSHAVDAATSELRRIERDLHDGAQARLVALGMNLRAVERVLPTNPQAALALVAEARESSVRALNELRDLIRGIYPPVLADRGLGHAVRALALDTPMPTELDIDLPGRLSAPVESACYFAIAEALANAVKHSSARRVQIRIRHSDDVLRIQVTDDGIGGADPAHGTGLQGVEKRLGTFDGILAVSSPPGGPTMIVMEVPCELSSPKTSSS
jgi:signal transduction histidine kinase